MSKFVDYYSELGIGVDATPREVRVAFLRHAKEQHPDVGGSHEIMQRLNRAYETLANPTKRTAYDKIHRLESHALTASYKQTAAHGSNGDDVGVDMSDDEIDDFINSVFVEYATKEPEPKLHKKASKVVRNYLRSKKQDKNKN